MRTIPVMLILLASVPGFAEEALVTLRSTVTGSQDQPKVMYLLPWQQPGDAEFEYHMRGSFAEELFVPLDRDEFVRGLEYQALLDDSVVTDADTQGTPDD